MKVPQGMPLVRMKAAPVKTDGERLGNEFMNGVFFSAHVRVRRNPDYRKVLKLDSFELIKDCRLDFHVLLEASPLPQCLDGRA